jgi:uncharacterized caspase-like protein
VEDLGKKLSTIDFKVTVGTDLTNDEMDDMIIKFVSEINAGDLVLFFFTGYGVQWSNQNFLLPIDDNRITDCHLYKKRAVNAQDTLNMIMNHQPLAAVFLLDCYHSQPKPSEATFSSDSNPEGFCTTKAVPGSLIFYNCTDSKMTRNESNAGRNGILTTHLLEHIATPNRIIHDIMTTVHDGVLAQTKQSQVSLVIDSLRDIKVYLNCQKELGKSCYLNTRKRC